LGSVVDKAKLGKEGKVVGEHQLRVPSNQVVRYPPGGGGGWEGCGAVENVGRKGETVQVVSDGWGNGGGASYCG
jgi:hypothetical protein